MRIRSTKPEFWKSKRIASVSWEDRLLLKGLESYVDDNGVGVDDVELIVTDVFPRDMFASPRETVARVSEGLCRLQQAGLVHRYSTDSDNLLYISFWEDIQRIDRPGKGRYPRPDGTFDYKESVIRESVASPRESVATGTGEQGNRGTEEQGQIFSSEIASDPEPADDPEPRPDIDGLLDLLDLEIQRNGNRPPKRNKTNHDAMRLLLDRDNATEQQIAYVIRWAQNNQFWKANILSAAKLREKFPQLVAKIRSEAERPPQGTAPNKAEQRINDHRDIVARLAEREDTTEGELL